MRPVTSVTTTLVGEPAAPGGSTSENGPPLVLVWNCRWPLMKTSIEDCACAVPLTDGTGRLVQDGVALWSVPICTPPKR